MSNEFNTTNNASNSTPNNSSELSSMARHINGRIETWKSELLDLTKRNSLLSFKPKTAVSLLLPDLQEQELTRKLFESKDEIRIESVKDDDGKAIVDLSQNTNFLERELAKCKLYSEISKSEIRSRLLKLSRKTNETIEEMGVNTLFLSWGILEWKENDDEPGTFNAPIILIPIKLERHTISSNFSLSVLDDEPFINMTLLEMLRQDRNLILSGLEALPELTDWQTIDNAFHILEDKVNLFSGWKVHRQKLFISTFSFQKYILWRELNEEQDILTSRNSIVDHLVNHAKERDFSDGIPERKIDQIDRLSYKEINAPLGADSSQMRAIASAMDGKSFILNGPPGTGKSQTIANIIANSLFHGKTVIFVAEKKVALDVVYRRLQEIGLESFCLELHANKANKKHFYSQLEQTYAFYKDNSKDWQNLTDVLNETRTELNTYVEHLYKEYPCGFCYFDAIAWLMGNSELKKHADKITLYWGEPFISVTSDVYKEYKNLADNLADASNPDIISIEKFQELKHIKKTEIVSEKDWETLSALKNSIYDFRSNLNQWTQLLFGKQVELSYNAYKMLDRLCIPSANYIPEHFYSSDFSQFSKQWSDYVKCGQEYKDSLIKLNSNRLLQDIDKLQYSVSDRIQQFGITFSFDDWNNSFPVENQSEDLTNLYTQLRNSYQSLRSDIDSLCNGLEITLFSFDEKSVLSIIELCQFIVSQPRPESVIITDNWQSFTSEFSSIIEAQTKKDELTEKLSRYKLDSITIQDINLIKKLHKSWKRSWWLFSFKKKRNLKTSICNILKEQQPFEIQDVIKDLHDIGTYLNLNRYIQDSKKKYRVQFDAFAVNDYLDSTTIQDWVQIANTLEGIISQIAPNTSLNEAVLFENIGKLWIQNPNDNNDFYPNIAHCIDSWEKYEQALVEFFRTLNDKIEQVKNESVLPLFIHNNDDARKTDGSINLWDTACRIVDFLCKHSRFQQLYLLPEFQIRKKAILKNDLSDNWDELTKYIDYLDNKVSLFLRSFTEAVLGNVEDSEFGAIQNNYGKLYSEKHRTCFSKDGFQELERKRSRISEQMRSFANVFQFDFNLIDFDKHQADWLDNLLSFIQTIEDNHEVLHYLINWNNISKTANEIGFGYLTNAIACGEIASKEIPLIFKYVFLENLAKEIQNNDRTLSHFSLLKHDSLVERFQKLQVRYQNTSKINLAYKINQRLSVNSNLSNNNEISEFRRELKLKRHQSIRSFIKRVPNVFKNKKPCLLMSPLSVAQYLSSDAPQYDIVIFDEASQIPVWDAAVAIARGKQLIVAGDPKQLPPTTFFHKDSSNALYDNYEDEPESTSVRELASLLDECQAIGMHEIMLNWHYRSKHESLIAYSNNHYYDNQLITFPSSNNNSDFGIEFKYIPQGSYARGSKRTNEIEAQALVKDFTQRVLSNSFRNQSIGIITFNIEQQVLIEDLLEQVRADNPSIDEYFINMETKSVPEPVFVKSIEGVQGDERDIIYFSIGYSKDAYGKLPMIFGPLNKDGGEKRLNVALTRSKEKMILFSSILQHDFDLSRTNADGVKDLAGALGYFKQYSETGQCDLATMPLSDRNGEYDSDFEKEVADFLRSTDYIKTNGYEIETQIGVSKYRIDLAVKSKDSGKYLVGIECDGATYHSSATARDRDFARQRILEKNGWNICRVWSTTWWQTPHIAQDKLLNDIRKAINKALRENSTGSSTSVSYSDSLESNEIQNDFPTIDDEQIDTCISSSNEDSIPDNSSISTSDNSVCSNDSDDYQQNEDSQTTEQSSSEYNEELDEEDSITDSDFDNSLSDDSEFDDIYDDDFNITFKDYPIVDYSKFTEFKDVFYYDSPLDCPEDILKSVIERIIEEEGPITEELIIKRVVNYWQVKAGKNIKTIIIKCCPKSQKKRFNKRNVYWPIGITPEGYDEFRTASKYDLDRRNLNDIPYEEIKNALLYIVHKYPNDSKDEWITKTINLFGWTKKMDWILLMFEKMFRKEGL